MSRSTTTPRPSHATIERANPVDEQRAGRKKVQSGARDGAGWGSPGRGLALALVVTGCSSSESRLVADGGPTAMDVAVVDDASPLFTTSVRDALAVADRGTQIVGDAACATATAGTQQAPVNLLLLLDRSASMAEGAPISQWAAAVAGIRSLLDSLNDDVRVGLTMYSSPPGMGTIMAFSTPSVPVAPLRTTRSAILSALAAAHPEGNSPLVCAMEGTGSYYRAFTADGTRNVILITAGRPTWECITSGCDLTLPSCQADASRFAGQVMITAAGVWAARTPPTRVFVAGTPGASATLLSEVAFASGTGRTSGCRATTSCYYPLGGATFGADLASALGDIRVRTASCEFAVDADPSRVDPTHVNVTVTGSDSFVPRDTTHTDGWDYSDGMRSVVLYGATCTRVLTATNAEVRIVFGCPTLTPG